MNRRARVARGEGLEAPLVAYRAAAAALPGRDAPLIDRLFALECLAHAGREAKPTRERLLPARRTVEDYISDEWEPDVPHVNVLAQALATVAALDQDAPTAWPTLLDEALATLEPRRGRLGLASAPSVLASVIRGLAATDRPIPNWLLDAVRAYFESSPDAVTAAEFADALRRHRNAAALAHQAAEIVFSERHASDRGVAIARWWLAERMKGELDDVASADKIASARAQALVDDAGDHPRLGPMLAEVAARAIGSLVLLPETELERIRDRAIGRALVETYAWRTITVIGGLVIAGVYATTWLAWLGVDHPTSKALSGVVAGLAAVAAYVVIVALESALTRLGRQIPAWLNQAQIVVPILVAAIAFILHP
jgi:hypothetical protein